jgi:hypothetical protein
MPRTFEEIIRKNILFEDVEKRINVNTYKIFYKIDLKISNKQQEEVPPVDPNSAIPPETQEKALPDQTTEIPQTQEEPPMDQLPDSLGQEQLPPMDQLPDTLMAPPQRSVQTEAEDETKITNENEIIRKTEGEIKVDDKDVDTIQTIDDLLDYIAKKNDEDGSVILDEMSVEVIQTMIDSNMAQQVAEKIDKKDHVFLDLIYGRKKDDDNIGIRVNKRKNSDSVSINMIKDGEMVIAPFNLQRLNDQILNFRNLKFSKKGE